MALPFWSIFADPPYFFLSVAAVSITKSGFDCLPKHIYIYIKSNPKNCSQMTEFVDQGRATEAIYVDFSKVFNSLPQYSCIQIGKLWSGWVETQLNSWAQSTAVHSRSFSTWSLAMREYDRSLTGTCPVSHLHQIAGGGERMCSHQECKWHNTGRETTSRARQLSTVWRTGLSAHSKFNIDKCKDLRLAEE